MITNLLLSLILGAFVGGIAGYIGSLMLTKRMALIGGPLGHLAMPGMAIAFLYDFDVVIGALLFITFGTALIWLVRLKTKLPFEAITATVFASSLSVALLILPKQKVSATLVGDLSQISLLTVLWTTAISILVFVIIRYIYSKMVLVTISSDLAKTTGINVKLYNFIYLTCIALVIAMCVRVVGGLMTAALVAIPACTSKNICINLSQYAYVSMIAGAVSSLFGIMIGMMTGIAIGPLIIVSSALLFVISIFVKPKMLWG